MLNVKELGQLWMGKPPNEVNPNYDYKAVTEMMALFILETRAKLIEAGICDILYNTKDKPAKCWKCGKEGKVDNYDPNKKYLCNDCWHKKVIDWLTDNDDSDDIRRLSCEDMQD